jgi:hypothetical protein
VLKTKEKIAITLLVLVFAVLVYGVVTDCPNVVGYHKNSGGLSCSVH